MGEFVTRFHALPGLSPTEQRGFILAFERAVRCYDKAHECTDQRIMAQPHHQRIAYNGGLVMEAQFIETFMPKVAEMAKLSTSSRHDIMMTMASAYPNVFQGVYQENSDAVMDVALRLMVHYKRVRFFQTTDALENMLNSTDFGDDVPASWFRIPFDGVFIEFGETRRFGVTLFDPESGNHVVEGAYIFEGMSKAVHSDQLVRGMDIVIFGSPIGKSGLLDDVFVHFGLPLDAEDMPITALMQDALDMYCREGNRAMLNRTAMRPIIEHLAKVLVYLNTKDARQREVREGSEARKKADGLKSPGKRDKALRQAARHYDRIVIGPSGTPAALGGENGGHVRPHVRRGHFRMQACGPRHSERRPVWLQPMLIGSGTFSPDANYVIR